MLPRRAFAARLCLVAVCLASACGRAGDSVSRAAARTGAPRYPVVLHHGFLGFDRILTLDYFYKVRAELEAKGAVVRTTHVPPVNTIEVRTRLLAEQIDRVLEETGAAKVNLIAHSMGGLDARHLVSALGYGDRVASVITVGTPHGGTPVADAAYRLVDDGEKLKAALGRLFLGDHDEEEARDLGPVDLEGALWNLTTEYSQREFEPTHPDDPRVVYESWTGHCNLTGIGSPSRVEALLLPTYAYLKLKAGDNDGLVPVESARHGLDRGVVPADHVNEVGQLFGHVSHSFGYLGFYGAMVADLAARGL